MIPENIELDISSGTEWNEQFPEYKAQITACFEQIMADVPEAKNFGKIPHLELSVLLTDDQNIQELNRDYRGKDKATNVLSFPSLSAEDIDIFLKQGLETPEFPIVLGDIIFGYQTIASEARNQGKSFSDHFCHLCLHGMLHLIGYDHVEDGQAGIMEALEKRLLSKLSIDDPY
ncbi:MAG: rRNA maturation RNase YbeY [Emcibacter sp.]|nr:rRNA maturation RNase YbeY [Emcibacter sp.]